MLTGVEQVTYLNSVIMPDVDDDEASSDGTSNAEEPEQD